MPCDMLSEFYYIYNLVFLNNLAVKKKVSFVEVINIRTHSRKTNKLRNVHHRKGSEEHLHHEMRNLLF